MSTLKFQNIGVICVCVCMCVTVRVYIMCVQVPMEKRRSPGITGASEPLDVGWGNQRELSGRVGLPSC